MMNTIEQLVDIYYKDEWWHKSRLSQQEALDYHKIRLEKENIYTYQVNGEVVGYYERYFENNVCLLYNVFVKEDSRKGKIFKHLHHHFMSTLPIDIDTIMGEKQKLGGKIMQVKLRRKYG